MSKRIYRPVRAIHIGIVLALALSLMVVAAPAVGADPGRTEWSPVKTPSEKNETIVPGSELYDFAVGPDGETIYAIGEMPAREVSEVPNVTIALWKSTDGGATWKDKTDKLLKKKVGLDLPAEFARLTQVAVAPDDEDFVMVAGTLEPLVGGAAAVVGSTNGATKFYYTGDMTAGGTIDPGRILCLDVSRAVDAIHNLAVGTDTGYVLRYEAGGYWGAHWVDATGAKYPDWKASTAVTSVAFSPAWSADKTVLAISTDDSKTWLQSGKWGTAKGWGPDFERAPAVEFKVDIYPVSPVAIFPGVTGMALPSDYDGAEAPMRRVYAYVDAVETAYVTAGGYLFRIDNIGLSPSCGPAASLGKPSPWFASIAYHGTHDEGDAMMGMLGEGQPGPPTPTPCCKGIQVWRTDNIDVCCPTWHGASKKPTGQAYALVAFTPDGKKAYATTMDNGLSGESAFSVSLDLGKCWNQLGLIDTDIDYLSDIAVSPDCDVTYLASMNSMVNTTADLTNEDQVCGCDSVWMKDANATEYADVWQRVYWKPLEGDGLLRLSPEHDDGDVVFWGDYGTKNLYQAVSKGICKWRSRNPTKEIQDFALGDDDTIYVINNDDDLVKWTPSDWSLPADTMVAEGHTVAVVGDFVLVGGGQGSVGYSDDAGKNFSRLGDKGTLVGQVHVAFDSYFEANDTVYAAVKDAKQGIWRWVIGQKGPKWKDLEAEPYDYFGIVLDNAAGNPKTKAETGGVLYATYEDGVARCLTPAKEVCCGEADWDYLEAGLPPPVVGFTLEPSSLKICGCLTGASNSNLFGIDDTTYDMSGKATPPVGVPWTYEDCFAKAGVTLKAVKDGAMVAADPCFCYNEKFVLEWERLCNECEYDLQISLDEDFTQIVLEAIDIAPLSLIGDGGFYDPPKNVKPSLVIGEGDLDCNTTYYWRVRTRVAETDDAIRSWWSDAWSFTVEAGLAGAISLTAPEEGATGVALEGVVFTWTAVPEVTSYDFNLMDATGKSIESKTGLTVTSYVYAGKLDYDTAYTWQVKALKDGDLMSKSSLSTFRTAPKAPAAVWTCPQCGLTFPSEAALKAHIAEAHPAPPAPVTPAWVWVVIGIGAVLVISVIVLIFRTRRV